MSKTLKASELDPLLIQQLDRALREYADGSEVFYIDIGYDYTPQFERKDKLCVRVHVHDKGQTKMVNKDGVSFFYYQHSVQEPSGPIAKERKSKNAIQSGLSIGGAKTGTLGAICYDKSDRSKVYLLTCYHIMDPSKDSVFLPSLEDSDGIRFQVGFVNRFCAVTDLVLVEPFEDRLNDVKMEILGTSFILSETREVELGKQLKKSGRTTCLTNGIVDGICGIYFPWTRIGKKSIQMNGCFRVVPLNISNPTNEEITSAGDSGAIWFDPQTGEGIGIHFDGEKSNDPKQECAFAQDLGAALTTMNVSLMQDVLIS